MQILYEFTLPHFLLDYALKILKQNEKALYCSVFSSKSRIVKPYSIRNSLILFFIITSLLLSFLKLYHLYCIFAKFFIFLSFFYRFCLTMIFICDRMLSVANELYAKLSKKEGFMSYKRTIKSYPKELRNQWFRFFLKTHRLHPYTPMREVVKIAEYFKLPIDFFPMEGGENNMAKPKLDVGKIRAEIARLNLSKRKLASELGIHESTFSRKINGKIPFTIEEVTFLAIITEKPIEYFFT